MSYETTFRFNQATFNFGDGSSVRVDLVADQNPKAKNTHFTLLMGANGTCKSRILSSCVSLLKSIHDREHAVLLKKDRRPFRSEEPDRDMRCDSANLMRDGLISIIGHGPLFESATLLPTRLLAVANLVRDRFTFVDWDDFENPFYYYLGVRQASNLTTTGAMDRLVCEAVLKLLADDDKYLSMSKWVRTLFPQGEMGLAFTQFSTSGFQRFFDKPAEWVKRRMGSFRGEVFYEGQLKKILPHMEDIRKLSELLEKHGQRLDDTGSQGMKRGGTRSLILDQLTPAVREKLGKLSSALSMAASVRLIERPSLVLKDKRWITFTQLSSGEQNLLATGARLFAFAVPGSLVVIDEPEVSLNIAWQQRYIDLISEALVHAKGSHVIIASHSPYLISDLRAENSTVVVIERSDEGLKFRSHPGEFWGWGSEAILYEVLGLPSASNYHFSRELAGVLKLVSEKSTDAERFAKFLRKCEQLDFGAEAEPLKVVIEEIRNYAGGLQA
jgi:ABC-type lipoprotein export system ATPase subunit